MPAILQRASAPVAAETYPFSQYLAARTLFWFLLCVGEALVTSWLFEVPPWFGESVSPFYLLRQLAVWALISAGAFAVLIWPIRYAFIGRWQAEQAVHRWLPALAINLVLFTLLTTSTGALTAYSASLTEPPTGILLAYCALLGATTFSLARIDLPISGALRVLLQFRNEIAIAVAVSFGVLVLAFLSTFGWEHMASGTLTLSKAILDLYESDVAVDIVEREIRIGQFAVVVTRYCSGYEGLALVAAFVSIYLWVFRSSLRFPRAFLLYPIGFAVIWLLNALRIALLASLGAHFSPEMAVQGFHSQAGWVAFLLATTGVMALAQRCTYFSSATSLAGPAAVSRTSPAAAYLAPFMGLMLASIVLSLSAPYDRPLYPLKVAAVVGALWLLRSTYTTWRWTVSSEAILAGLLVGALWIATDPNSANGAGLAAWLEAQGPMLAGAWILLRVIGSAITVPIAEELAFRGFLYRWLIARDFESVPYARASLLAIAASSLLFGLMHERWIAGALAGVVFAVVMHRTRSISGPIVAHMAANALICAWALAFRQWSLL